MVGRMVRQAAARTRFYATVRSPRKLAMAIWITHSSRFCVTIRGQR